MSARTKPKSRTPVRTKPPAKRPTGQRKGVNHEGATEEQTGDLTGPGAGYDKEPEQVKDKGGVA